MKPFAFLYTIYFVPSALIVPEYSLLRICPDCAFALELMVEISHAVLRLYDFNLLSSSSITFVPSVENAKALLPPS